MSTLIDPNENRVRAVFVKAHLTLVRAGMKHSSLSPRQLLNKATVVTGKAYKRGQYDAAITDLKAIIEGPPPYSDVVYADHVIRIAHDLSFTIMCNGSVVDTYDGKDHVDYDEALEVAREVVDLINLPLA